MIHFLFGLPGTGKSTFAKKHKIFDTIDIGGVVDRNDPDKVAKLDHKVQKHTKQMLNIYVKSNMDIYIDTYPEYFDEKDLREICGKFDATFAIPEESDLEIILRRLVERGDGAEFLERYRSNFSQWRQDWAKTYQRWRSIFGKGIQRIRSYRTDDLDVEAVTDSKAATAKNSRLY